MSNETPLTPVTEKATLADDVMTRIHTGQTIMKPKWHFVLGSLTMIAGLIGLMITSVFFVSFVSFFLRSHGPRADTRLSMLLGSFPWWALALALIGIVCGALILRYYDFSYRKNFALIVFALALSIVAAGWLINYFGLDQVWMKRGPMRGFYQYYDGGGMMRGSNPRMMDGRGERFR